MVPDLEMGSLRVEMRNLLCECVVVAEARACGLGNGSFGSEIWLRCILGRVRLDLFKIEKMKVKMSESRAG